MPKLSPRGRRYNWRPDLPDHRDHTFLAKHELVAAGLPSKVDLRPLCPPVVDQGDLGSCTANALAGALGFLELKDFRDKVTDSAAEFNAALGSYVPFSRLFIYWQERLIEGDTDQDGGAQLRDGIKALSTVGACSEVLWPYDTARAFTAPAPECALEAGQHKISRYVNIDNTRANLLRACLAEGYPFVFGFTVYDGFEGEECAATGMLHLPTRDEGCQGGHAVMCVGYDDARRVFIVRNSWGSAWGDGGYFYMPYAYMTDANLADDFWTLRR